MLAHTGKAALLAVSKRTCEAVLIALSHYRALSVGSPTVKVLIHLKDFEILLTVINKIKT